MDNTELIIPPSSSHWSLRLVDVKKPFPNHIVANTTYKIIRFFYPPFALEAVNFTHEVSNPELNPLNVGLLLGCSLFATGVVYAGYKYFVKEKTKRLPELEARTKSKHGSEYKLSNWERKDDIADPLLADSKLDLPRRSTNVIVEAHWLPESIDDFVEGDGSVQGGNDEVSNRPQIDVTGDKQGDLAEQINRAVWESNIPKIHVKP